MKHIIAHSKSKERGFMPYHGVKASSPVKPKRSLYNIGVLITMLLVFIAFSLFAYWHAYLKDAIPVEEQESGILMPKSWQN